MYKQTREGNRSETWKDYKYLYGKNGNFAFPLFVDIPCNTIQELLQVDMNRFGRERSLSIQSITITNEERTNGEETRRYLLLFTKHVSCSLWNRTVFNINTTSRSDRSNRYILTVDILNLKNKLKQVVDVVFHYLLFSLPY